MPCESHYKRKVAMSPSELDALIAAIHRRDDGMPKQYWYAASDDGPLEFNSGKPTASEVGSFTGRAGTMRRTRKGATRRNTNGSRKYIAGCAVAYKV